MSDGNGSISPDVGGARRCPEHPGGGATPGCGCWPLVAGGHESLSCPGDAATPHAHAGVSPDAGLASERTLGLRQIGPAEPVGRGRSAPPRVDRLGDRHNDPERLLASIVEALDAVEPLGPDVAAALAGPQPSTDGVVLPLLGFAGDDRIVVDYIRERFGPSVAASARVPSLRLDPRSLQRQPLRRGRPDRLGDRASRRLAVQHVLDAAGPARRVVSLPPPVRRRSFAGLREARTSHCIAGPRGGGRRTARPHLGRGGAGASCDRDRRGQVRLYDVIGSGAGGD